LLDLLESNRTVVGHEERGVSGGVGLEGGVAGVEIGLERRQFVEGRFNPEGIFIRLLEDHVDAAVDAFDFRRL
jgi:hypothetical protein